MILQLEFNRIGEIVGRGCSQAYISIDTGRMSSRQELSSGTKQLLFTGGVTWTRTSERNQVGL